MWPSGSRASRNGGISVFTKRHNAYEEYTKSQLTQILRGYYPSRAFYSPRYTGSDNDNRPDYRTTLLWAPLIVTDEHGTAKVTFFTSEHATGISISAEGITGEGIPVMKKKTVFVE